MMDTFPSLTVLTLNCQGIRKDADRRQLFHFLRQQQADLICLQETHAPVDSEFWTHQWRGPAVWSHHLGLLLNSRHQFGAMTFSDDGRIGQVEVTVRGRTFVVVNMYAPSLPAPRRKFFLSLQEFDYETVSLLLGDWNSCPDPLKDRIPAHTRFNHWG